MIAGYGGDRVAAGWRLTNWISLAVLTSRISADVMVLSGVIPQQAISAALKDLRGEGLRLSAALRSVELVEWALPELAQVSA